MTCYAYIIEGTDNTFYTGITGNLRRRIEQHNGISWLPGARYTKSRRPLFLVHVERFDSRREARFREKEIKTMSHGEKIDLISRTSKANILSAI